jgi:hypothetical protein
LHRGKPDDDTDGGFLVNMAINVYVAPPKGVHFSFADEWKYANLSVETVRLEHSFYGKQRAVQIGGIIRIF